MKRLTRSEVNPRGWNLHMDGRERHVWPVADAGEHELEGEQCPCVPRVEEYRTYRLVIHSAFDRRELTREVM